MAVANNQIVEIYNITRDYIDIVSSRDMYKRLMKTQAYEKNASYRETINRLYAYNEARDPNNFSGVKPTGRHSE